MSVEKVKYITRKPKEGKIFITSACSNVFPKTYYKWEFMGHETDYHKKELELMRGINGGGLVLNNSCYEWNYARMKANKELYDNEGSWQVYDNSSIKYKIYCLGERISDNYIPITQEELKNGNFEEDYKGKTYTLYRDIEEYNNAKAKSQEELEKYYKVFVKYLEEKHEGQYYLYSQKYGYVKPKGASGSFYYSPYNNAFSKGNIMDYKKAYCISYSIGRDIEIKRVPSREYKPTNEQLAESRKRIELLGLKQDIANELYLSMGYGDRKVKENEFNVINAINEFEKEYNSYVYYIIFTRTNFGDCYSMLYVSNHKEEWGADRKDIENKEPYAYVYNETTPYCSEIGSIGVEKRNDCLVRTF